MEEIKEVKLGFTFGKHRDCFLVTQLKNSRVRIVAASGAPILPNPAANDNQKEPPK